MLLAVDLPIYIPPPLLSLSGLLLLSLYTPISFFSILLVLGIVPLVNPFSLITTTIFLLALIAIVFFSLHTLLFHFLYLALSRYALINFRFASSRHHAILRCLRCLRSRHCGALRYRSSYTDHHSESCCSCHYRCGLLYRRRGGRQYDNPESLQLVDLPFQRRIFPWTGGGRRSRQVILRAVPHHKHQSGRQHQDSEGRKSARCVQHHASGIHVGRAAGLLRSVSYKRGRLRRGAQRHRPRHVVLPTSYMCSRRGPLQGSIHLASST